MSTLDDLRNDMIETSNESKGNEDDFSSVKFKPNFKTYIIRIIPPSRMKEKKCFYATHSYNYINDEALFSLKKFGDKYNPIDTQVRKMYDEVKETGNKILEKKANAIKRKRNYYMEILLLGVDDTMFETPMYKVLVDSSNRGLLTKKICVAMGVPFFRDLDDKWVDENTKKIDPDKEYINLIDVKEGYDVKITREKTGNDNWDIDYTVTPLKKKGPRPLTKEEREIVKENRVDIFEMEEYVTDIKVVKAALAEWFKKQISKNNDIDEDDDDINDDSKMPSNDDIDDEDVSEKTTKAKTSKSTKDSKSSKNKKDKEVGSNIDDDEDFDKMLKDMENDESSDEDDDI